MVISNETRVVVTVETMVVSINVVPEAGVYVTRSGVSVRVM